MTPTDSTPESAQRVINYLEYPCGCHAGPADQVPPHCPEHSFVVPVIPPKPDLDHLFRYHVPTPETLVAYGAIREAGKAFAQVLVEHTPAGADQAAALRHVREAVMTANAGVALEGRINLVTGS